jgi:nucleotide-binding universal stress UspA family protein
MGTHGRRGLAHLLLGSVAEKVVRQATVPVVTVRSDAEGETPEAPKISL